MMPRALPLLLLTLLSPLGHAERLSLSTDLILKLYSICLNAVGDHAAIATVLDERDHPRLSHTEAKPFLGAAAGAAWPADMPFGKFVLASREDGLCAVYAKKADTREVERAFVGLLGFMQQQMGGRLVKAHDETHPNGRHLLSYHFGPPPPEDFHLQLGLSTLAGDKTELQALLTYRVIPGPVPAPD